MTQVVKVAKIGADAGSTDPNDFIFHSSYNTFKIIKSGTKTATLLASTNNQSFTAQHFLDFIPLPAAFAKQDSVNQVFLPNATDVDLWGPKLGFTGNVRFNHVSADVTNVIFNFDNSNTSSTNITVRYFLLEQVD